MRIRLFAIIIFVLGLFVPVFGQTFGDISGAVKDATGAAIPAAQVTVINKDTNATGSVTSNDDGFFSFPALTPGTYNLKAEKTGYKTAAAVVIIWVKLNVL